MSVLLLLRSSRGRLLSLILSTVMLMRMLITTKDLEHLKNELLTPTKVKHLNEEESKAEEEPETELIQLEPYQYLPIDGDKSKSILSNYDDTSEVNKEKKRVVILVGPHKTGSSTIQHNFYAWTSSRNKYYLPNWSWPTPLKSRNIENFNPGKLFAVLVKAVNVNVLYNKTQCTQAASFFEKRGCTRSATYLENFEVEEIIQMFRDEVYHAWMSGYNVIIASESIDTIQKQNAYWKHDDDKNEEDKRNPILDGLMDIMPWRYASTSITKPNDFPNDEASVINGSGSDADMTFVVTYRAPRASHVVSLWHQLITVHKMLFSQFLIDFSKEHMEFDLLTTIDSLGLVKVLLDRGLNVILVDMDGVKSQGYDLTNYIACTVLDAPCNSTTKMLNGMESDAKVYNARSYPNLMDVPEKYIDMIEIEMQKYDCQFQDMVLNGHENLTMLLPHKLIEYMEKCDDPNSTLSPITRTDLLEKFVSLGEQFREESKD